MNINRKITILIIITLLIISVLSILISAYSLRKRGKEEIAFFKKEIVEHKQQSLRNLVDNVYVYIEKTYQDSVDSKKLGMLYEKELKNFINMAYTVLASIQESAIINEEEKKALALYTFSRLRINGDNYFWINDTHPKMIMHPFKSELDGQDLTDFKDPNGKRLFSEMAKVCLAKGEGVVDYMWPKPGSTKPVAKISYVKLFKPWNWIIGTGVYFETAEKELRENTKKIVNSLRYGRDQKDYFYIFNTQTQKMIVHPNPELIGADVHSDVFKDPTGKNPVAEQLQAVQKSADGISYYQWPKLGHEKPVPKMTYYRFFKPWNWVIATGVYMDDVETAIATKEARIEEDVRNQTLGMAAITLLFTAIVVLFVLFFSRKNISNPIQDISDKLTTCTETLDTATITVFSSSEDLAARASEQAASIEEISSSLEEISAMTRQNALHSKSANEAREEAKKALQIAGSLINQSEETMLEVNAKGQEMVNIVNTIDGITFQTNLLALNAAIEAARAGEAGSGFAVVADEVRSLARRTAREARNIQQLIEETVKVITQGADNIQKASEAFDTTMLHNQKVAQMLREIERATVDQAVGIDQINSAVSEINQATQQNADNAESFVSTAHHMSRQAESMNTAITELAYFTGKQQQAAHKKNNRHLPSNAIQDKSVKYILNK